MEKAMKYTTLVPGGLAVSRFCLGYRLFDAEKDNDFDSWMDRLDEVQPVIQAALDAGVNFFDATPGKEGLGSEQIVGQTVADLTRRNAVVLSTSFIPDSDEVVGLSPTEQVKASLSVSLQNLNSDYVDLYWWQWKKGNDEEVILRAMNEAYDARRIRGLGIAGASSEDVERICKIAKEKDLLAPCAVKTPYNLIDRTGQDLLNWCQDNGLSTCAAFALAGGTLAQRVGSTVATDKKTETESIARLQLLAQRYDVSQAAVAIAWVLTKVTVPMVGVSKVRHFQSVLDGLNLTLSKEDIDYLEELTATA